MFLLLLIGYLLLANLATYYLYWHDKRAAVQKNWRVPENVLLGAGFMGGTPAALWAQHRLRHKLKKSRFQYRFWALTVIQVGLTCSCPPLFYM